MEVIHKGGYTKAVDRERRIITAVISTGEPDRDGDVVEVSGWRLEAFLRNPVVLWMHKLDAPVGRCLDLRVEGNSLVAETQFATTPLAEELWALYRDGFLRAWSVAFIPKRWEPLPGGGRRYLEQELVEYSCVSVPSNPGSLTLSGDRGERIVIKGGIGRWS